jgi:hypothetical protein
VEGNLGAELKDLKNVNTLTPKFYSEWSQREFAIAKTKTKTKPKINYGHSYDALIYSIKIMFLGNIY